MDIRVATLEDTLRRLIAGAEVTIQKPSKQLVFLYEQARGGVSFGLVSGNPDFIFVLTLEGAGRWLVTVSRRELPFTKGEELILGRLAPVLTKAFGRRVDEGRDQASQLGSLMAFDHLLVASVLRKAGVGKYWTHLTILQGLIDLTFCRYEGTKATSGVLYTAEPALYLERLEQTGYRFTPFVRTTEFRRRFFVSPASYRYVDGRNAFYLVDNNRNALGVLRSMAPEKFNLVDRCSGLHVESLVRHMPGSVWCAYVGLNDDVQVRAAYELSFCWASNAWRVSDDALVRNALREAGMSASICIHLAKTLRALSETRKGALILVPQRDDLVPHSVGRIDTSDLSVMLNEQLESMMFESAYLANAAVHVLSSDGMTVISKDGRFLSCGRIIDLANVSGGAGGGRTQAAMAGSQFGLAIKVSEDGPITAFRNGRRLFSC